MSKKYKLIKKYPGHENLGYIIDEDLILGVNPGDYPEFWEEVSDPSFKTEDDVRIYFDTKLYGVCLSDNIAFKAFELIEHDYKFPSCINQSGFKWFADKSKAINYMELNKPRFSMQNIIDAQVEYVSLTKIKTTFPLALIDFHKLKK